MTDYYLVPREDEIEWISEYISKNIVTGENKKLALNDIKLLSSLNDEFVFKSYKTNKYISPSKQTELFNIECNEILEASGYNKIENNTFNLENLSKLIVENIIAIDNVIIEEPPEIINNELFIDLNYDNHYIIDIKNDSFEKKNTGSFLLKSKKSGDLFIKILTKVDF